MTRRRAFFFVAILFSAAVLSVLAVLRTDTPFRKLDERLQNTFRSWSEGRVVFLDNGKVVLVKRVVDGDTIELENGEKLRYIGINAPESVKPGSSIECFGKEASARNKELVEGKAVRLEKDVSERDRYGRLLRYVYLEDGTFVNEELVREGYAVASTFPPDVAREGIFRLAEKDARENIRGLWAENTCRGKK